MAGPGWYLNDVEIVRPFFAKIMLIEPGKPRQALDLAHE